MSISSKTTINRRRFLTSSGKGVVIAGGLVTAPASLWPAWVVAAPDLASTLLRMGRDIYPHDAIDDRYYFAPLKTLLDSKEDRVKAGLIELNNLARKIHNKPYSEIPVEEDRVSLLREIENSAFFQEVRNTLVVGLYNNPALWGSQFGYEGSAWEKGGYLNRGFDDLEIDWL